MARDKGKGRGPGRQSARRAESSRSATGETNRTPSRQSGESSAPPTKADTFFSRAQERRESASSRGPELREQHGPRTSGHGAYGAGLGSGNPERGGLVEPGGYREDVGFRGATDLGRASTPRQHLPRRSRWQREPVLAAEIMTRDVRAVRPGASLQEVATIMRDENTGVVPVVDERSRLLGLVTDRDIVMRTLPAGNNPLTVSVADVMTSDIEAVTPDESVRGLVELMGERQIRRVPVVDEHDRLVGIISMADVATRADYDEDLQDALEEISARRSFWSRLLG